MRKEHGDEQYNTQDTEQQERDYIEDHEQEWKDDRFFKELEYRLQNEY